MLLIDDSRQALFAKLSGDHNPLHVDATQARRSQFGGCVVHGVHLLLAALESLRWNTPQNIVKLDAQFRSAVLVGETISFTHEIIGPKNMRVAIRVGSQLRSLVDLETKPVETLGAGVCRADWPTGPVVRLGIEELTGLTGNDQLAVDLSAFSNLFPSLAAALPPMDAAALLGVTRVVGMQCPGQWALFRRLLWHGNPSFNAPDLPLDAINYSVVSTDRRFSMITLAMKAARRQITAEVVLRQPPPVQVDLSVVKSLIAPGEFSGARALIVGGSRGLGELAAKILIAGGAEVLITYRTGEDDAARVVSELGVSASMLQFRADAPDPVALEKVIAFSPSHISYFATPIIAKRPPGTWDPPTFDQFVNIYVTGFSRLLAAVQSNRSIKSILFPSSTYIDERPSGFSEYVAGKMAGEAFCETWHYLHPAQHVMAKRLPPLITDQTSGLLQTNPIINLEVLLPLFRQIIN